METFGLSMAKGRHARYFEILDSLNFAQKLFTLGLWAGLPTLPFSVSSSRFLCHFLSYENIKVVGQKNKK